MKKELRITLAAVSLVSMVMLAPSVPVSAHAAALDQPQFQIKDFPVLAQEDTQQYPAPADEQQPAPKVKERTKHPILMYLPNRIFDLLDILRLRVRVGPGISAGVRATRPVSAYVGFHSSIFAGLPGPRGKAEIPLPVGFDTRAGAQVSLADVTSNNVYYDPLEVGLEVQPLIVGFNFGIGVFEIVDFATGFLFIDLQDDDF